jgi:hypothetical protein
LKRCQPSIFGKGVPLNNFLKAIGVGLGARDLTAEASGKAKQAAIARQQVGRNRVAAASIT